jgi:preprotein translocase subunit SecD
LFAGVLLLLLAAGCGSETSTRTVGTTPDAPATSIARLPADTLTFRPVIVMCETAAGATCANDPTLDDLPSADPAWPGATYVVGPVVVDASSLESATASMPQGSWVVNPVFREGADGIDRFNAAAAECFAKSATCPTGQLAIVIDGEVISAPSINEAKFERDQIQISGNFDEASATALAAQIDAATGV